MMPPLESGLPNAGYWGTMTCDEVPAWQFMGEVVKVDGRRILDQAPNGVSPAYTVDMVRQAEQEIGRSVGPGDVVLYWSGYVDKYDQPGEAGRRLHIAPLEGTAPAYPAPGFDVGRLPRRQGRPRGRARQPEHRRLRRAGLRHARPAERQPDAEGIESHLGLFKHGGIDIEGLINFDKVPNGSLFIGLPVKHVGAPTAEMRAAAITDPELARELIAAVRARKVVDLTVPLAMDNPVAWPGSGIGNYAFPT
jgi:kynurenine formamidase